MTVTGVDYAFSRPSIDALRAAEVGFVVRYGGVGSSTKWLTATEAQDLSNAGIAIVANVEGAADGLRGGYATGAAWADAARSFFEGLGMPPDRPIYLSADWDVQPGELPMLGQALRGAASVLGVSRVGLYGGYAAVNYAHAGGLAHWLWQTYAWSGGLWHPAANVRQTRNGVLLGGISVDYDEARTVDYGQWTVSSTGGPMDPEALRLLRNAEYLLSVLMFSLPYDHTRLDWGHGPGVNVPTSLHLALADLRLSGSVSGSLSGSLSGSVSGSATPAAQPAP